MPRALQWNRRHVLESIAASTLLGAASPTFAENGGFTAADYGRATIIDCQGGFGAPSKETLDAIGRSGLTAVSTTIGVVGNGPGRFESVVSGVAGYSGAIDKFPDHFLLIRRASDLKEAKRSNRTGVIFNLQDTSALEGDLSRIEELKGLGIRVIQLTYNKRNLCGDGCLEPANEGVSEFGRQVVNELGAQKIVLDLSHGGERTILEAVTAAKAPPIVSHTGCRELVNNPRNVRDRVMRAIADKGGVIGIYFMSYLSSGIGDKPRNPTREDLFRHLDHAINVCGEDHVGIGTDGSDTPVVLNDETRAAIKKHYEDRVAQGVVTPGDGPDILNFIPEYNVPERFLPLGFDLSKRGWSVARIEKILGGNFARVFDEVWDL